MTLGVIEATIKFFISPSSPLNTAIFMLTTPALKFMTWKEKVPALQTPGSVFSIPLPSFVLTAWKIPPPPPQGSQFSPVH